jgi:hypothetical protein
MGDLGERIERPDLDALIVQNADSKKRKVLTRRRSEPQSNKRKKITREPTVLHKAVEDRHAPLPESESEEESESESEEEEDYTSESEDEEEVEQGHDSPLDPRLCGGCEAALSIVEIHYTCSACNYNLCSSCASRHVSSHQLGRGSDPSLDTDVGLPVDWKILFRPHLTRLFMDKMTSMGFHAACARCESRSYCFCGVDNYINGPLAESELMAFLQITPVLPLLESPLPRSDGEEEVSDDAWSIGQTPLELPLRELASPLPLVIADDEEGMSLEDYLRPIGAELVSSSA